jgi:hypothetical protein
MTDEWIRTPPATNVNGCTAGVIGRGASALTLALGIAFASTAKAFSPQPVLHLDASAAALGAALALPADAPAWRAAPDALGTACTPEPGVAIRIALLAGSVPRLRDATCRRSAAAQTLVLTLGHEALDSVAVFRAFGAAAPRGTAAAAGTLLAPAAGTPSDALLGAMVLEHGCVTTLPMGAVPHAAAARSLFCAALSEGSNVVRRRPGSAAEGVAQIRAWAASALAGAIAAISLTEWIELTGVVTPMPLDGVLPTAAKLAADIYPASRQIKLAFVVPRAASQPARNAALDTGFALLAETVIGPLGTLAGRGITALPPATRVDARLRLVDFLEAP